MTSSHECLGAVLAGGESSRMGRNKALLPLEGRPVIAWVLAAVSQATGEVIISADDRETYAPFGRPVYPDARPGHKAMGGVFTALQIAGRRPVLTVSCDLPFVSAAVLKHLIASLGDADVVVSRTRHGLEPLCAVYAPTCLPAFTDMMAAGNLALQRCIRQLNHRIIDLQAFPLGAVHAHTFHNLNTPADYEAARQIAGRLGAL